MSCSTTARRGKSRRTRQLALQLRTWGGARAHAGRKPKGARAGVPHTKRPELLARLPVHVTLRMQREVWNLRSKRTFRVIDDAIAQGCARAGFRLVHHSVQGNHIHCIIEAQDAARLSRGMQGLGTRIARRLNGLMQRRGKVFADRFHAHILRTPAEVRAALVYVFGNFRKHARPGHRATRVGLDPYSSARQFDGWKGSPPRVRRRLPEPRTWLLQHGWRRLGLIDPAERPRPLG